MDRLFATVALIAFVSADFGDPKDIKQVKAVVSARFGHALHVSISHDWALATAEQGESDWSVVLHRSAGAWKIVAHDGGAYGRAELKSQGVPEPDIAPLLRAYQ